MRLKDFDSNSTSCCCVHCKPQKKTITKLSVVFRVANLAEIHVQLLATMKVFFVNSGTLGKNGGYGKSVVE